MGFDERALEDVVEHSERTKATRYADHTFLTVYATRMGEQIPGSIASRLLTAKVSIFVLPTGVVTVRHETDRTRPVFDIDQVVRQWDDNSDLLRLGSRALLHGSRSIEANDSPALTSWYQDLYDHVIRAAEWTDSLRDMITTVFETNLSLQDARLNTIMKKLTGWAAIIAVPTLVTGWYGQNIPYPGFSEPSGVVTSAALSVATSLVLYFGFKRRNWI